MLYTIGYQRISPQYLKRVVEHFNALVVDVRSNPHSRLAQFNMEALQKVFGARYAWAGHDLGGRKPISVEGIATLRAVSSRIDVVLLGVQHLPSECHRHTTICGPHFPEAMHICDGGLFSAAAMSRAISLDAEHLDSQRGLPAHLLP